MPETTETPTATEATPQPTKRTRTTARKAKAKAKPRTKAKVGNKWTPDLKRKLKAAIKSGRATYVSVAKDMGITSQTVWAQLHR